MNSVKSYPIIEFIGTYGKLAIIIISILVFAPFLNRNGYSTKLRNYWALAIIYVLLVLFSLLHSLRYHEVGNLIYNIVLIFYIFFYYFMIKILWGLYFKERNFKSFEFTKLEIIKVYRAALLCNLIFWFSLAFINNINLSDDFGDFGGFFQDKIHFGLFSATGFLACFYLRFNDVERDKSKLNLVQLVLYAIFAFYTSRNALLIVVVAPLYFFIVHKAKNYFYVMMLLVVPLIVVYFDEVFLGFSTERLNGISSGRIEIWRLALEVIFENGIFNGSGLFNINDIVLENNLGTGFYYLDTLDFLYFHSSFVELLAGGGLIALILFLWVLGQSWKYYSRVEKALVSGILIGSIVESYLTQPFMLISSLFYFVYISNASQMRIVKLKNTPKHLNG